MQTHNRLLFLVFGPLKVLLQALSLYLILVYRTPPAKWLLLQNPPSLPTIPIALLATFLRRTHLIIDWHNLGFSILALRLSPKHPLVRLAAFLEASLGRHASASFAVTHALAAYLRQPPFSLTHPVLTVHDRPAPHFQPLADPAERAIILRSCSVTAPFADELLAGSRRLLLSSTSWTADEDFGPLLRALECYAVRGTVKLLVVITGKGLLRAAFLQALGAAGDTLAPELVAVRTTFLPSAHAYAQLLAAADLGLCLHTSSSGLDLPMKVVDMFGAGLPVLAYDGYASFSELVQEGVNGMGFRDGDGLGRLMIELLGNEIQARRSLDLLKRGALRECGRRWDDEWIPTVGRLLQLQA